MAGNRCPHHGRTTFFIQGEGFAPAAMPSPRAERMIPARAAGLAAGPKADESRAFRFCRMFPGLPKFTPSDAGLIALGEVLDDPFMPGSGDSTIPGGFTYFGQFVDHDITFDRTNGEGPGQIPAGALEPGELESARTPALELDSLYGRGPKHSSELYESDGTRFRIGATSGRPIFGVVETFPNDLPRRAADGTATSKEAVIGDPRNDENLIVAQTHLAFLKLHNEVVKRLAASGTDPGDLFAEARKTVLQHYQSIVLHDLLPRLVDRAVLDDVLQYGRKYFFKGGIPEGERLCMPVEFSVAAYRLGHSMIRNAYQWNRVFSTTGPFGNVPGINLFFEFSGVSGDLGGSPTLPSDWIVDWRRMYDFSEQQGGARHPQLNFARQLDTRIAAGLKDLPEFALAQEPHLRALAVRNLLRGRLLGLPTGQALAGVLGEQALTPAEVASGPHSSVIVAQGFDVETPLWFYILKEAELQGAGLRLGRVGSRILVETFHGLIEGSEHSILASAAWKSSLPAERADRFTMLDLLKLVADINPLGDGP